MQAWTDTVKTRYSDLAAAYLKVRDSLIESEAARARASNPCFSSAELSAVSGQASTFSRRACFAPAHSYPGFAFSPAASMPAIAQISSLSEVSPETPTAPSSAPPSWIKTPPGTGIRRPCAIVFTASTK